MVIAAIRSTRRLFFGLERDDLLAAVVAGRADVVAQMHFAAHRLDGKRGLLQVIMRAMHAALGRGLLVLLDCHDVLLRCGKGAQGAVIFASEILPSLLAV